MHVIYTMSHRRRPVFLGTYPVLTDRQAAIPAGWCSRCGAEVYRPGRVLCDRCRKEQNHERIYRT